MTEKCKGFAVGVDEAGRGPLIGPMVLALVVIKCEDLDALAETGIRDSKDLEPYTRRRLFETILSSSNYVIYTIIPPAVIDSFNLNQLEYETIAYMLKRLREATRIEPSFLSIYIDAVGPVNKMRNELRKRLPWLRYSRLIVEPKADSKYVVVGAASIIAKVVRDKEIEKLRELYGIRGSGYPTDQRTIDWLREAYEMNPDNPPWFVRRTWSTLRQLAPKWYIEKRKELSALGPRQRTLTEFLGANKPRQKQG
ncbi:ribonuclease HII [Pyrofollis japonicus]|uniref:ribonuclease HII n=1 Tax=Pyrofollis japonicus TaxID=3060460 RepID=UPI00295B58F1|nr:ribonuclease HII [Pyrofollis japonicus]